MKEIRAAMAGTVMNVNVSIGDKVEAGQDVVILESMKMEVPQSSEESGTVKEIHVSVGDFVNEGDLLVTLE